MTDDDFDWFSMVCQATCACECTHGGCDWTEDDYAWCAEQGHGVYP